LRAEGEILVQFHIKIYFEKYSWIRLKSFFFDFFFDQANFEAGQEAYVKAQFLYFKREKNGKKLLIVILRLKKNEFSFFFTFQKNRIKFF